MAIHPLHAGLNVSIVSNGQPLTEFDDDSDQSADEMTVTQYVEATSGDEFEISIQMTEPFPIDRDVVGDCYVDGHLMVSPLAYRKNTLLPIRRIVQGLEEKRGSLWYRRHFCFGDLKILGEDPSLALVTPGDAKELGTISVKLYTTTLGEQLGMKKSLNVLDPTEVCETAIKGSAKSLSVVPGQETVVEIQNDIQRLSDTDEPLATFIFNYRSKADLEDLHIPRSPPATPRTPTSNEKQAQGQATTTPPAHIAPGALTRSPRNESHSLAMARGELLHLLGRYRGNTNGLDNLPESELEALLLFHRDMNKAGPSSSSGVGVNSRDRNRSKRGHASESGGSSGKKIKKEVVELDD